jgi:Ca2+-dependent lipid-binding protein
LIRSVDDNNSLSYVPWVPTIPGDLVISIVEAKGLAATDTNRKGDATSDPFARVFLEDRTKNSKEVSIGQTETLEKTLTPVWNETFEMEIEVNHKEIIVEVCSL